MNEVLLQVFGFQLTGWKLIGFAGCALFTGRWLVQVHATQRRGSVSVPPAFWWFSIAGSVLMLSYFSIGAPDAVGVLSNLLPLAIAGFNLRVVQQERRTRVSNENRDMTCIYSDAIAEREREALSAAPVSHEKPGAAVSLITPYQ
jgi:lipid-A-disaccharide synthase-like uncharacterized protein